MFVPFPSVYDQVGAEGIERVVAAFYRHVAEDPILRPMYPEADLGPAERRLRLFLIQFFGGPSAYSDERGHPRLRLRHTPFRIDQAARDVWVRHMLAAVDECAIPEPANSIMRHYFERTATGLINRVAVE